MEQFVVLYINSDGDLIGAEKIAMGQLEQVRVNMSEVFRGAILAGAPRIVVGHNHPTGRAYPSDADIKLTMHIIDSGKMLGIEMFDHIIVAPDGKHYSMMDLRYSSPKGSSGSPYG